MKRAFVAALLGCCAIAQNQPQTGSVSGTVRDASTNLPLPDLSVSVAQKSSVTDTNGHYSLTEVAPGRVTVYVNPDFRKQLPGVNRSVSLAPGQDLTGVDLTIRPFGTISGKVVDQNGEPVTQAGVSLVARQYWLGAMRYNLTQSGGTDDQGNYVLRGVQPGRAFLLVVHKRDNKLDAISNSPLNPKLRRPAWVPTFYPGTPSIEGAQAITLAPGEKREAINFQIIRAPSLCIAGTVQAPLGGGRVHFQISESQPTFGTTGDAGTYGELPNGNLENDGKFRICNLHAGQYELETYTDSRGLDGPPFFSKLPITLTDQDLERIAATPSARIPIAAEAVWEGTPPDGPARAMQVSLQALTRTEMLDEGVTIPGKVSLKDAALDEYLVRVNGGLTGPAYIKDITYGQESVLHKPLRPGSATGDAGIKIVVAADGGRITAKVADKDGNAISDAVVIAFPASAATEIALADVQVTGRTDQNGSWTSPALAPGKYDALALDLPPGATVDRSPESLAKLLRARGKAQEIELGAGQTSQVTLTLTPLD